MSAKLIHTFQSNLMLWLILKLLSLFILINSCTMYFIYLYFIPSYVDSSDMP
jgi:hypothetical protein